MRFPRGDGAVLGCVVLALGCGGDSESTSPGSPGSGPTTVPQVVARALTVLDDDRAYIAAGDTLTRLRVRALDEGGRPVRGVRVRFAAAAGGDTITVGVAGTDSAGVAIAPAIRADTVPGRRRLVADAVGLPPVTVSYLVMPSAYGGASQRACPLPATLLPRHPQLTRTLAALSGGAPLTVVAIGSSSTQGVGASSPAATYPARLQARLRAAYPASGAVVWNKGSSGQLGADMVARFNRDVFPLHPQLVIWQTGTIEATSGASIDGFEAMLRDGIARLRAAGADVLLVDSQAGPGAPSSERYVAFQQRMAEVGAALDVPVVMRYRLMQRYQASGRYTWSELLAADAFHPSDLTYDCMAHWMTAGIMAALVGGE